MPYLSTTVNWDTIRSITHPKVSQKIADNITNSIALFSFLDKMGNKELEYGGESYQLPVFKELATAQAYTGMSQLTNPEADPATTAIYQRKQLTVPIVATGTNMLKNNGGNEEAVINYMTFLVESAEQSMKATIGGSSLGIFSNLGESDTGVTGLQNICGTSTTTGTVGGLSRATYSWWRHKSDSVTTGFSTDGLQSMDSLFYQLVRGDEAPSLIVLTRATFANLKAKLQGTISYNLPSANAQNADVGFPHIYYNGVPCVLDSNCPDQTGYFLNLKYFKLMVHADRDMAIRDFITPSDGDYLLARIYWAGNLVCNNLSMQGLLTGAPDTNS